MKIIKEQLISTDVDLIIAGGSGGGLEQNTTIDLNSSMTVAEINALIDAQPKDLNGHILTLQFADGTYTIDTRLKISGFYGEGQVIINGNIGESASTLHTNQAVVFDCGNTLSTPVYISQNSTIVIVRNIKFSNPTTTWKMTFFYSGSLKVVVNGCYFVNDGAASSNGAAIWGDFSKVTVEKCYFSGYDTGIGAERNAELTSVNNASTGTNPRYGLKTYYGVIITSGTQPSGWTANESANEGGVIR